MPPPPGWDADAALAACPFRQPWQGIAWRFHQRRYAAVDHGGSLRQSGRYHRAADRFPPDQTWPALYLSLDRAACIGEVQRHLSPAFLPRLRDYRLTTLRVELVGPVVDCNEPALMGLDPEDLCHDIDWEIPQRLAAAAIARGVEGMVVPSATRLGSNLVIFPLLLRPDSTITELSFVDPRLYVERP